MLLCFRTLCIDLRGQPAHGLHPFEDGGLGVSSPLLRSCRDTPSPVQGFLLPSEGFGFFCLVRLLLRRGVAQLLHDAVEVRGVGLGRYDGDKPALVPAPADRQIEHAVLLFRHPLEARKILRADLNDGGRVRISRQPRGARLPDHLVVLPGQGKQQRRDVFDAAAGQLDRRFRCLQALLDHQIGGLCADVHKNHFPFRRISAPKLFLTVLLFCSPRFRLLPVPCLPHLLLKPRRVRLDAAAQIQPPPRLPQRFVDVG